MALNNFWKVVLILLGSSFPPREIRRFRLITHSSRCLFVRRKKHLDENRAILFSVAKIRPFENQISKES